MKASGAAATLQDVARVPADLDWDQGSYYGRFRLFLSMTDPSTLLTTPARLAHSQQLIRQVDSRQPGWECTTVQDYQDARKRVRAIVHPESQKPIFLPCRFSAFVPMNFINLCGMLHPTQQTPLRSMFWQFTNQTYNVGFNYCNGSGKEGLAPQELLLGYSVATLTACGLSYGLSSLVSPSSGAASAGSVRQRTLRLVIPYTAVACANIANLAVIRARDVVKGISVQDANTGRDLCDGAPSAVAGRLAVAQVAISRVLIPVPLMLFPPVFLNYLFDPSRGVAFFVKRKAWLYMPVNVATLVAVLTLALPAAIAVFPQQTTVRASWLEKPFREAVDDQGRRIETVTFNKGL